MSTIFRSPPPPELSNPDDCTLSVKDRAISTILTALVGSIVTGISNGPLVAFFVGWICWLAAVRLVLVSGAGVLVNLFGPIHGRGQAFNPTVDDSAVARNGTNAPAEHIDAQSRSSFKSPDVEADTSEFAVLSRNPALSSTPTGGEHEMHSMMVEPGANVEDTNGPGDHICAQPDHLRSGVAEGNLNAPGLPGSYLSRSVTTLGSIGWIYTFLYSPIIQVMWVKANWDLAPPALFIARAIGVGVTALTYTFDTRARYGLAFGKRIGSKKIVPKLMTLYTALVNLLLTIIVVVLLIRGLTTMENVPTRLGLAIMYVIFSCIWAFGSFQFLRPTDAGRGGATGSLKGVLGGLFMGAFSGLFIAAPAFALMQSAEFEEWGVRHGFEGDSKYTGGKSLGEWLKCSTDAPWKKVPQILP